MLIACCEPCTFCHWAATQKCLISIIKANKSVNSVSSVEQFSAVQPFRNDHTAVHTNLPVGIRLHRVTRVLKKGYTFPSGMG